jgi:hypothetical protein
VFVNHSCNGPKKCSFEEVYKVSMKNPHPRSTIKTI